MISQADLKVIQTVFGKTAEELSGAISSEQEVSLGLRLNGRVISQEVESALKTTLTDAGVEIGLKKIAKEIGLTLEAGEKDAKIIAEKLKASISTELEEKYKNPAPGEKERELEEKLIAERLKYDKLFGTHDLTLKQIEEKEKAFNGLQKEIKTKERNNSILKTFPEKMKMNRDHALLIITNTFEFDEVDGQQVIKKGGQVVTDAVGKPEKLENIIPSFVEENGWVKGSGMGGDDRPPTGSNKGGKTPDEAAKIVKEKYGDNAASTEGIKLYSELTAKIV